MGGLPKHLPDTPLVRALSRRVGLDDAYVVIAFVMLAELPRHMPRLVAGGAIGVYGLVGYAGLRWCSRRRRSS